VVAVLAVAAACSGGAVDSPSSTSGPVAPATTAPAATVQADASTAGGAGPATDGVTAPAAGAGTAAAPARTTLWALLRRQDGMVLLMRHATAPGSGDPAGFRLGDCTTQGSLSEDGRREAAAIGAALRAEGVPVTRVLTSRWCQAVETARLLGVGAVEESPAFNDLSGDRSGAAAQNAAALALLAEAGRGRGVTVVVTHSLNVAALAGRTLATGAALVVAPSEEAVLDVVGEITQW